MMDPATFYKLIKRPIQDAIELNDLNKFKDIWLANPTCHNRNDFGYAGPILHLAASGGSVNICNYLIKTGHDVNQLSNEITPLDSAAGNGHLEVCKLLINNGAQVDGSEKSIASPLSDAIVSGHTDVALYLIEKGADINRLHIVYHQTPLDLAKVWGRKEISNHLERFGAKSTGAEPDWSTVFGGSILYHVHLYAGPVLPIEMSCIDINNIHVELHLALVNKKKNNYLFTVGLFSIHKPMIELFIALPEHWNMYDKSEENLFPSALLLKLSEEIINGLVIDESYLISATDEKYSDLKWPEKVAGFYPVDFNWNSGSENDYAENEECTLLTLMPIKKTKSGIKPANIEKNRQAKWGALTLKIKQEKEE